MGEGEVCVVVVSNVGEMENEKNQQKRDRQWLTGGSDMEPAAKKQVKEGSVEDEADHCGTNQSEVAVVSIKEDPCTKRQPTEGLNDIKLETFVDRNLEESSDGLELESCDTKRTTEALNDNIPGPSDKGTCTNRLPTEGSDGIKLEPCIEQNMEESSNGLELEPCGRNRTPEAVNDNIPGASNQEPCNDRLPTEGLNNIKLEACVEQNMEESLDGLEPEPCSMKQRTEALKDSIPGASIEEPCNNRLPTEGLNDIKLESCVEQNMEESLDGLEPEPCSRKQTTEALNDNIPEALSYVVTEGCTNRLPMEGSNGIKLEPFIEQNMEGSADGLELEPCGRIRTPEALNENIPGASNEEPCTNRLTTESLTDIKLESWVEQNMEESLDGLEPEPCSRKQITEALNDNVPEASDVEPVQQCLMVTKQTCEIKQATECLNSFAVNPSVAQPVKEGSYDMELDPSGEKHSSEVSNNMEIEPIVEHPVKDCLHKMQRTGVDSDINQDPCGRMQTAGARSNIEAEPSIEQPVKECPSEMETKACGKIQPTEALNESEPEPSGQEPVNESHEMELEVYGRNQTTQSVTDTGTEPSDIKQTTQDALNDTKPVKECLHEMELEVSGRNQATISLKDAGIEPSVIKQTTQNTLNDTEQELPADPSVKEGQIEMVIDPCTKKEVGEASNDDISSEVSNPNVSPRDNSSSFQTVNSQPDGKRVMKDQVVCGEIASVCSGNSSSEGSSSEEDHDTNDTSGTFLTSHVVIEVPKHASTSSGIRKITFKFSKRKEDYDSQLAASAVKGTSSAFDDGTRKIPRLTHNSEQGLHEHDNSLLYPTNMELMPGKVVPESYPTTVKRLLSTRILEGAKVKYVSALGELIGIVKDCGYLCGCATCNFSNVLRAHEFEEHAGGKTRHPNNHIYLENGKPIYSVIQAMKAAPLRTVDEAIKNVAGSSVNEEHLQVWKGSLQRNMDRGKVDNSHHMKLMNLYHSTTSCTSHMKEDSSSPYYCYRKSSALEPQTFDNETVNEGKCLFKKPRSYTPSAAFETKRSAEGGHKKRDNDLHRLLFMPNGLPDGTELAYYARGKKILDGYKQGSGIVCSHCDTEISPSQFEAHAGWAAKRQPYRHIYIPNGLTLHDIALLLANGQSIATSNSDDMCAACGDRGELVICDGCPRAFHAACLGLEGVPSEDWLCPYCRDSVGSGRKASAESRPIVIRLTRVVKAREYETGGCVICRAPDFSVAAFDDRTVMLCDQCEKEYHVGCLRESGRCDLKALPSDKWFCCDHCDMIHGAIQDVVVNGEVAIPGSVLSMINKKHIEKGVFSGAPYEIRWRMLSGKSRNPEHMLLMSEAAAIFRECFDPIVAKSGRDLIPVMVYGRNISGQEFGGIYCVVLMVGPIVVSAGLLRIFGREVAELPLVATSRQHQGKGYFKALFFCIEELLLSLGVDLLVLPAAEEAESIWSKKLGFRKMSDERYSQYSRDIQLTIFKGTSMLEKELRRPTV